MPLLKEEKKLKKELRLFDVFAIATGAMFSSGLFLLPGIAAAETGPSAFLAYLVSGLLVLPTMVSKAELATALPRAGGTYYIIDRSLGPLMGSIGGFGSWLSLTFKSAFALIGMGAYISLFFEVPITPVAVILTVAFGLLNIVGAKETSTLQKGLVVALISIMAFYLVQGFSHLFSLGFLDIHREQFTPLFTNGPQGFFATVGMVFVSYAGLTKVASIAEEVENPDRNIPRGMFLSIFTAITVYGAGVYLMTAVLEPGAFRADLTPVATAGDVFLDWLPGDVGLILVVAAAIAAFASTANAGVMSSSRFPLAMSRDSLLHPRFSELGKFNTPTVSIIATVGVMLFILLAFNVAEVAKLASAFKLLIFGLLNLAVIVMRESRIEEYDPGYRSPFYPWVQLVGMLVSALLIFEMGMVSILFTVGVTVFSVGWYYYYAYGKIDRVGAIYHVHERLGRHKDHGLEREMRNILREKGLREEDPYEIVISQAGVIDLESDELSYEEIVRRASAELGERMGIDGEMLFEEFSHMSEFGAIPIGKGASLYHTRLDRDVPPQMVLVRVRGEFDNSVPERADSEGGRERGQDKKHAMFFLVSSQKETSQHLRFLAHLAEMIDQERFLQRWLEAGDEMELREILLRDERFINLRIRSSNRTREMIGKKIREIDLPGESLVTILKRGGETVIPHGDTVVRKGDRLSIIGEVKDIEVLKEL